MSTVICDKVRNHHKINFNKNQTWQQKSINEALCVQNTLWMWTPLRRRNKQTTTDVIKEYSKLARLGETDKSRFVQHSWKEEQQVKYEEALLLTKTDQLIARKLKKTAYNTITYKPMDC